MSNPSPATFFSYAREDAAFALRLAKDLRTAGASIWLDQLDIKPGQRWDRAVEDALACCPNLLVVLSPVSVDSTNVMDEVSLALDERKTVIPVVYHECKIPFRLRRLQYVDLRHDYNSGLHQLLETLGVGEETERARSGVATTGAQLLEPVIAEPPTGRRAEPQAVEGESPPAPARQEAKLRPTAVNDSGAVDQELGKHSRQQAPPVAGVSDNLRPVPQRQESPNGVTAEPPQGVVAQQMPKPSRGSTVLPSHVSVKSVSAIPTWLWPSIWAGLISQTIWAAAVAYDLVLASKLEDFLGGATFSHTIAPGLPLMVVACGLGLCGLCIRFRHSVDSGRTASRARLLLAVSAVFVLATHLFLAAALLPDITMRSWIVLPGRSGYFLIFNLVCIGLVWNGLRGQRSH